MTISKSYDRHRSPDENMPTESSPKMELVNDLTTVIAIYSTTQITFSLLTFDTSSALRLYQVYLWRSKASYESRGLMIDDDVVAKAGWFAYYLIQNRTFFGYWHTYYIWGRTGEAMGPAIFIGILDGRLLVQRPDRQVEWDDRVIQFQRRIVFVGYGVIVTEDGALYLASNLSSPEPSAADIVQAIVDDQFVFTTLERDGSVRTRRWGLPVNLGERVVSMVMYSVGGNILYLRTSRATEIVYDPDSRLIVNRNNLPALTYNITPELRFIDGDSMGVRPIKALSVTPEIVIDIGRSLIIITKSSTEVKYREAVQTAIYHGGNRIELILDT